MQKPKNAVEESHLRDLTPDPDNVRKHTPRNVGLVETSLRKVGAARSIVIDERGVVLAGNATVEAAASAGIEKVLVVETDGNTIVAVKRTGLTPEQKRELALMDNRSGELAEWDVEGLKALLADYSVIDASLMGFNETDLKELEESHAFEPRLDPTYGNATVEEGDVASAAQRITSAMVGEDDLREVFCPECRHRFYVKVV